MLCDSLACDIESGAMIDRGTYERQTQSNIYRLAKRETLHRNHCLIVITSNYGIKLSARRAQKYSVGGVGTSDVDVVDIATRFDGRRNFRSFFHPKQSALSAMWIERSHRQPWTLDAPPF